MSTEIHTIYIKRVHNRTKKVTVTEHRVWNADKFLASQLEAYAGDKVRPEEREAVSVSNYNEYKKHNIRGA